MGSHIAGLFEVPSWISRIIYDTLQVIGVGKEGQRILDLGTGTGVLARAFASRGAVVTGIDVAEEQILQAKALAAKEGVSTTFETCAAEEMNVPDDAVDKMGNTSTY